MTRLGFVKQCLGQNLILWLGLSFAFALCYYLILMAALIIRFENFPNYLNAFDWRFNIQRIWVSTPSLLDTLSIMRDEWLFEIGFMNYAYGTGISEWSLFIAPAKVLAVLLLGAAVSANFLLLRATNRVCTLRGCRSRYDFCLPGLDHHVLGGLLLHANLGCGFGHDGAWCIHFSVARAGRNLGEYAWVCVFVSGYVYSRITCDN